MVGFADLWHLEPRNALCVPRFPRFPLRETSEARQGPVLELRAAHLDLRQPTCARAPKRALGGGSARAEPAPVSLFDQLKTETTGKPNKKPPRFPHSRPTVFAKINTPHLWETNPKAPLPYPPPQKGCMEPLEVDRLLNLNVSPCSRLDSFSLTAIDMS